MSKSSAKAQQRVTEYFASVQYGICQGQVDSLNSIRINEKIAWSGIVVGPTVFSISEKELFGGLRKEGGVSGHVFWQDGSFGQYSPASLAAKFDRTPANMIAYRGLANAFFTGPGSLVDEDADTVAPIDPVEAQTPEQPIFFRLFNKFKELITGNGGGSQLTTNAGFYWSANQPFIWPCHFGVTRIPRVWYPEASTVYHTPEENFALFITIEDTSSMSAIKLANMKTAVNAVLDVVARTIRKGDVQVDFGIGKWGTIAQSQRTYIGATEADVEDARTFLNNFNGSSGEAVFTSPALQARDFFAGTVSVVEPEAPELVPFTVRYQPGGGGDSPPNFYFGQIDSFVVGAQSPPAVSFGDEVLITYQSGLTDTITIQSVITSPDKDLWWEFSGLLPNKPLGNDDGEFVILLANEEQDPPIVTSLRDIEKRIWLFLADGPAAGESDVDGAAIVADLIDQTTGIYSTTNKTAVDIYAVNIQDQDTSSAQLFDNTPGDGVPVIDADDVSALIFSLNRAAFKGKNPDANPSHIIYECLTDSAWGMGASPTALNSASFAAVADTLIDEGFGLGMIWTRQQPIEDFIKEVLDHIDATLYVDPSNGQFTLKLIRDDYDIVTLPLYDLSNMKVRSFSRRAASEIINEINLTWTNPENEKEEVITGQDLGAIIVNNGVINSDSRNYYGVRDVRLATDILARDLSAATAPLSSAEIEVNRIAWNQVPGGVIRFYSPEHNAGELVMRVSKINYGRPGDSKILISLTQDIFSFQKPTLRLPPKSQSVSDNVAPEPFRYVMFQTLNHFFNTFYGVGTLEEPEASIAVMASTRNAGAIEADVLGEVLDSAGNATTEPLSTISLTSRGLLALDWDAEAITTTAGFNDLTKGQGPVIGGFAVIQSETDPETIGEIVLFSAFSSGLWTVKRGLLDTVPRAWPSGTPIRFFNNTSRLSDAVLRASGVPVELNLLMRTRTGLFPAASSPLRRYTPNSRAYLPTRPANVTVNGQAFSTVQLETGDLTVTWADRNRLTEDSQPLDWTAPSVTPEEGQTTTIRVLDTRNLAIVAEYTGLIGGSYVIPNSDLEGTPQVLVRVLSARDGLESFQSHDHLVDVQVGYGIGYGYNYGGDARAGYGNGYGYFYGGAN